MKRAMLFLTVAVVQTAAVLLFVRLARATTGSPDGGRVTLVACLVYGVPAVAAFVGHMRLALAASSRLKSMAVRLLAAGFITIFVSGFSVGILQRTDMRLTVRYIERMQTRLSAEPRFQRVRLLGYSCDYILFPYIPVDGDVPTEQDREDLDRLLKSSSPPVYVSAVVVSVGGAAPSPEDFAKRVREK